MQLRERQRDTRTALTPAAEQADTRRGRRRLTSAVAVSTAILGVLVFVTLSVMIGGESRRGDAQPASAAVAEASDLAITEASRLQRAVTWIDGLAAGLILPHEVTSRLAAGDPELARVVQAAWSDMRSLAASELGRAVRWIDGLSAGLILPQDVTARLAAEDPDLARVVRAAWSDLAPVADRGADG